jgi:hypothetical protein
MTTNGDNLNIKTFCTNILLSNDFPMGRAGVASRMKGDWFHSVTVITKDDPLRIITEIPCDVVHFHGDRGSPVLDSNTDTLEFIGTHKGKRMYRLSLWPDAYGVVGKIRDDMGYTQGSVVSLMSINDILEAAYIKWSNDRIPYIHQYSGAYNCVGFSDDLVYMSSNGVWNPRISRLHSKYGLFM